jgi:hypothetical protein
MDAFCIAISLAAIVLGLDVSLLFLLGSVFVVFLAVLLACLLELEQSHDSTVLVLESLQRRPRCAQGGHRKTHQHDKVVIAALSQPAAGKDTAHFRL